MDVKEITRWYYASIILYSTIIYRGIAHHLKGKNGKQGGIVEEQMGNGFHPWADSIYL